MFGCKRLSPTNKKEDIRWMSSFCCREVDSNPIKSNRPVACLTNQFANWFYPYCFALQSKPSNPPSPTNKKDIAFGGVFFVAERRIRTHLNPTGQWPVGKNGSQTGFHFVALPRKASRRIHLSSLESWTFQRQILLDHNYIPGVAWV